MEKQMKRRSDIKTSKLLPKGGEYKITVDLHNHGGDTFVTDKTTPTDVWLRDCEIQIKANENQKVSISREDGLLVVHFWSTGFTAETGPDYKVVMTPLGYETCKLNLTLEECIKSNENLRTLP